MLDGVSAVAVIAIASFAIDRIVSGVLFVISLVGLMSDPQTIQNPPRRLRAEKWHKVIYFVFAAALSIPVLAFYGQIRIFKALGFADMPGLIDASITGLILVAGADRLAEFQRFAGARAAAKAEEQAKPSEPVQVVGRLFLEERRPSHKVAESTPKSAEAARDPDRARP